MYSIKRWGSIVLVTFLIALTSCYKKDAEEFDNIKYKAETDVAISLFNTTLSIKDSLSFIPNRQISGSLYLVNPNIPIGDSVGFKLNGYTVKEAELKIYLKNNFPVQGDLQVYFLDANNDLVDSLFTTNRYQVGYSTSTYTIDEIYLSMDEAKLKKIIHCSNIKIVYGIKMSASVTDNYSLFVGCGIIVKTEKTY